KVGDHVENHQPLLEVETDKAVAEVPSPKEGYVISIKGGPGDIIKVGEVIAVIGDKAELGSAAPAVEKPAPAKQEKPEKPEKEDKPSPEKKPEPKKPEKAAVELNAQPVKQARLEPGKEFKSVGVVGELEEAPEEEPSPTEAEKPQEATPISKPRVEALPRDRMLAKELGVDIGAVRGTGPKGRVTEEDIRRFKEAGTPEKGARLAEGVAGRDENGPVERTVLRGVRRKIARAMVESMTKSAQVTTTDEADAGLLWHIREKEKAGAGEKNVRLTLLPFIVKAVVGALRRDPLMNSAMDDLKGEIVIKGYYNIGIAVETQDGLIVPNVKDADKKSILEIAAEIEDLAERARKRTLSIKELKGGTFTITNYGSIGGMYATPILNYPEAAILGVGKLHEKPVAQMGAIRVRKVLPLSLTFDHRVVDGATAQHFLNNVIRHIEDPDLILIGN
ncbi:MAG: dihydrolipoamide acetyltransferase family protein, partial [Nitrospirota bacterium]